MIESAGRRLVPLGQLGCGPDQRSLPQLPDSSRIPGISV